MGVCVPAVHKSGAQLPPNTTADDGTCSENPQVVLLHWDRQVKLNALVLTPGKLKVWRIRADAQKGGLICSACPNPDAMFCGFHTSGLTGLLFPHGASRLRSRTRLSKLSAPRSRQQLKQKAKLLARDYRATLNWPQRVHVQRAVATRVLSLAIWRMIQNEVHAKGCNFAENCLSRITLLTFQKQCHKNQRLNVMLIKRKNVL